MARIRNSIDTEDILHTEDADNDGISVASSSSSHCNLKACSASMNLRSSSNTRLSPSASSSSLVASLSKTSLARALSNTCLQAVTSGTEIDVTGVGFSFLPGLASQPVKQQTEPWINYGQLGTNSFSSSSLIFPKPTDPLFKQNFVANWITGVSYSQPEGPNIVPLHSTAKNDKNDHQQHGGGDMRWLDNLGKGYLNDRHYTDDVSMDTHDDKPTEIGSPLFSFQRNSTSWFKHNGETNAMETDVCMPPVACYIRPANFMFGNDVKKASGQITPQSILDIGEPMDSDDHQGQMLPWTQSTSSFYKRQAYYTAASIDVPMIIDNDDIQEVSCSKPMIVDGMLSQTNMGQGLFISQSNTNIEMLSPTPSIEMLPQTPSIEMLSPTPSIEMISPTPSIEMISPTPSVEMLCTALSVSLDNAATNILATSQSKANNEMASFGARFTDTKRNRANKRKRVHEDDDEESPAKRRAVAKTPNDNIRRYLKPLKHHTILRTRNK